MKYTVGIFSFFLNFLISGVWIWDFPGGPVVKTPSFHCRGLGFDPWSRTKIPHAAQRGTAKQKSVDNDSLHWVMKIKSYNAYKVFSKERLLH